jgi:hypothetical protein
VLEHWRHEPATLRAALVHDVLDEAWVDQVVAGTVTPDPGTVAFALNLVAIGVEHAGATTR